MKENTYLIDANAYMYRSFYAIQGLSNKKGQPTGALYGFITMLFKLLKEKKPEYLAIAFDSKGPTFRHEKYEKYKIQRKPMPDDLISQMRIIKDILCALNIKVYEKQGYEGDDILASLAKKFSSLNKQVFIVTSDKDMLQMVNENIQILSIHKEDYIYDEAKVIEKYGIKPCLIPDYLALTGDSADNIPGVSGIGEKTSRDLLKSFGSLEGIYNSINNISKLKIKNLLEANKENAFLSKDLATVNTLMFENEDIENCKILPINKDKTIEIFKELDFFNLISKLNNINNQDEFNFNIEKSNSSFAKQINIEEYNFLISKEENKNIFLQTQNLGEIYFKFENKKDIYFLKDDVDKISKYFFNHKTSFIGYDLKDFCHKYNLDLNGSEIDILIAYYLLNSDKSKYLIENICIEYTSKNWKENDWIQNLFLFEEFSKKILADIKKYEMEDLFFNIEIPLIKILLDMERIGIKINKEILAIQSKKIENLLENLTKEIYGFSGQTFNINSPKQLAEILFEKLKLPLGKKIKTGYSTNVSVLEKLAGNYKIADLILSYRSLSKLKNTYIDALPLLTDKNDRVHTTFVQTGTATGRLSSRDPNLQNIPIKKEEGKDIRKAFIAKDNKKILSADYSQIELRILAHLSEDPVLINTFLLGKDIHTKTASEIFYIDEEKVTSQMRRIAKTVNFGIIYGMSSFGLSKDLNISVKQAQDFIDNYFFKFSKVRIYLDELIKNTEKTLIVKTIKNRIRHIPDIISNNKTLKEFAKRTVLNTPMQGSAADLIKIAMINVYNFFKKENLKSKIILQIHDELLLEVFLDEIDYVKKNVKDIMEKSMLLKVPLIVDVNIADSWGEIK